MAMKTRKEINNKSVVGVMRHVGSTDAEKGM